MVVCGTSDTSRSMHVAAVFLTSHLRQAQYTQIFVSIFAVYRLVTGTHLSIRYVMGDADDAQFNGFEEAVVSNCPGSTYLMCFVHVMLNVKKKVKQLSAPDRSLVFKHVYRIHHARDQFDAEAEVADALAVWSAHPGLTSFLAYFRREWLESRFHRWQCYQSAIGHAKTNNPLEQFNKTFKRDYTLRQLLPLNSLMVKMQQLCKTKSVVIQDFKEASAVTADLPRRLKYLRKAGLLSHYRVQRANLNFLMDGSEPETCVLVKQHGVKKSAFPLTRSDQARLPSLYMETYKQPRDGWLINVAERRCPCSWWFKNGCCVHLLESLEIVGVAFHEGDQAEETFVSQRRRRRVASSCGDEELLEQGGRPTQVGHALSLE